MKFGIKNIFCNFFQNFQFLIEHEKSLESKIQGPRLHLDGGVIKFWILDPRSVIQDLIIVFRWNFNSDWFHLLYIFFSSFLHCLMYHLYTFYHNFTNFRLSLSFDTISWLFNISIYNFVFTLHVYYMYVLSHMCIVCITCILFSHFFD